MTSRYHNLVVAVVVSVAVVVADFAAVFARFAVDFARFVVVVVRFGAVVARFASQRGNTFHCWICCSLFISWFWSLRPQCVP